MNDQSPFMFMPEDNFNFLNDIKNLYSQINSIQQQLNSIEKRLDSIIDNKSNTQKKISPIPINSNTYYPTDNYII